MTRIEDGVGLSRGLSGSSASSSAWFSDFMVEKRVEDELDLSCAGLNEGCVNGDKRTTR